MKKLRSPRNNFEQSGYDLLKNNKIAFEYEPERIPYTLEGTYLPDFVIGNVYIEFKGFFRREDKRKLVAVRRCHPKMDIRIVFYRNNKADIKWADKHKFRWAVGSIPKEWLDVFPRLVRRSNRQERLDS